MNIDNLKINIIFIIVKRSYIHIYSIIKLNYYYHYLNDILSKCLKIIVKIIINILIILYKKI